MTTSRGLALIAGVGSGLGVALMKRFYEGGYDVIGLARSIPEGIEGGVTLIQVDLTNGGATESAVRTAIEVHGPPKVVIHNPAQLVISPFLETTEDQFRGCWESMVLSLTHLARAALPSMVENGGGAIISSGATASIRGGNRFAAFASAKFALRGLCQSLAREYQPQNVHVAHVLLDGIIDGPRSRELHGLPPEQMMNPSDIAETYWALAHQPKSTWAHELDLRPQSERF